MPFICLSDPNIPDGVVQILDLHPNESQKNNSLDGPGQTKYLNRVQNDTVALTAAGDLVIAGDSTGAVNIKGLAGYLADNVDPGGTQTASGTVVAATVVMGDTFELGGLTFTAVENACTGSVSVALTGPVAGAAVTMGGLGITAVQSTATGTIQVKVGAAAGNTVTIQGVVFTAVNGVPNAAIQQFRDVAGSGSAIATATSLVAAINEATPVTGGKALITAALDNISRTEVPTGGILVAANGGTDTVTLTTVTCGAWGDATLATNAAANFTLSGAAMTHVDPNPAAQEIGSGLHYAGASAINMRFAVASTLAATLNNAVTQGLIDGLGAAAPAVGGHFVATIDGLNTNVVNLVSSRLGVGGMLTMSVAGPQAGLLVRSAATLAHPAPAAATQEFSSFLDAGTDALSATTLVTSLNNAATDAALQALGGCSVTATNGGGALATVTMTADVVGTIGAMALASSDPLTLVLAVDHLAKTMQTWTAAQLNAAAASIITRMDAGLGMTATNVNTLINAVAGVTGVSITSVGSSSSLVDILSILAGRGYEVPQGTSKDPTGFSWDLTRAGSFTHPVATFGSTWADGEWRASTPYVKFAHVGQPSQQPTAGGDVVNVEYKPIRYIVDGTEFAVSTGQGQLAHYAAGVTLFPDSSLTAFIPTWYQPGPQIAQSANNRLVTVYGDDGALVV